MSSLRLAAAVPSLVIALGASTACSNAASETTTCAWNGCVVYATPYPTTVTPYTMPVYYDPVTAVYYARLPEAPGQEAQLDAGGGDAGVPADRLPELLAQARAGADAISTGIHLVTDPIAELVKLPAQKDGLTETFGPMTRGNAVYVFTIRTLSGVSNHFGWKLEARPAAGTTLALVAGGTILVGDAPQIESGVLGIDANALSAADSSVHAAGRLRMGFANDSRGKALRYQLTGYTSDTTVTAPIDATAAGYLRDQTESGLRVAVRTNLSGTATGAKELVVIKAHSKKDVGSRVDAVATGGDVPAGSALTESTCVGPNLDAATASTSREQCNAFGTGCTLVSGPESITCPSGLALDPPVADPNAYDQPAGMPTVPEVPSTVPDGTQEAPF